MSIFDKKLTSTTSTKSLDDFVREEMPIEKKIELQQRIAHPKKAKTTKAKPDKTNEVLERAHLAMLSKETPIERRLIYRAPDTWNFFGQPDEESYNLLVNSIALDGLFSPIILWEHNNPDNPEQRYMILSGHTRERAYDDLYQATGDSKYLTIPSKVYRATEVDENDARRIIILANVAQRAKESTKIRIKSYGEYARLTKERTSYGSGIDVMEKVAQHFQSSRATTYFYIRLRNLVPALLERFCQGTMTRADATIYSGMPTALQQYMVDSGYVSELNRWQVKALSKAQTIDDIDKIAIEGIPDKAKTHSYTVSLPIVRPKDSDIIGFCIPKQDSDMIRSKLTDLFNSLSLSDETRKLLHQQGY